MAHSGRLRTTTAAAVAAALSGTLFGAISPLPAAAAGGDPSKVALLPADAGSPTRPAWPEGTFDQTGAARPDGAPVLAGPDDGATLADAAPQLTAATQPGAQAYEFVIGTGTAPGAGQVTSSGWLGAPRWQPPTGLLKDGGQYWWTVHTKDASGRPGADAPARTFTVNQRLGAQTAGGPVAADTLGPVGVSLANGNVALSVNTPQVSTGSGPLGATFSYNSQAVAGSAGLSGSYYAGDADTGIDAGEKPAAVRTDARVDFRWSAQQAAYPGAAPDAAFRARWSGTLRVPSNGTYKLGGDYAGGMRILVDGKAVLDDWQGTAGKGGTAYGTALQLAAGRDYTIVVEYRHRPGDAKAAVWVSGDGHSAPLPASWLQPSGAVLPAGWSVTPAATGPDTTAAANAPAAPSAPAGSGASTAPADQGTGGAAPNAAPNAAPRANGQNSQGGNAKDAKDPKAKAAHPNAQAAETVTTRIAAAEDAGLHFLYSGAPECKDSAAPAGYVCAVSVPGAGLTRLLYRNGKLVRLVNPGGETTDLGFAADHRLTAVRTPLIVDWIAVDPGRRDSAEARFAIDYQGDSAAASRVTAPDPQGQSGRQDRRAQHGYRFAAGSAEVTVAGLNGSQGWSRKVGTDAAGRVLSDTDGTGRTVRTTWTPADQPASRTDAAGRVTTTVYNEMGLPAGSYGPGPAACFGPDLRPVSPASADCAKVPASTTSYGPTGSSTERADSDGVPAQVVESRLNELGIPATTVVDPKGLALATGYEFDASFRPAAKVNPDGTRQTFGYYGQTETAANPCDPGSAPAPQRGLPKSISLPASANGTARVEKFVYNGRGLPAAVNFGGADWACVQYDARGRIAKMAMPGNANLPAWTVVYDSAYHGDPLTVRASRGGASITTVTDLLGRTVSYTDELGTRTDTTYDRAGRAVFEWLTPPSDDDWPQFKQVEYDAAGRILTVTLNGRRLAAAQYDAAGAVQKVDYGNSTSLAVRRDGSGRITAKTTTLADGSALPAEVTRSQSGTIVNETVAGDPTGRTGPDFRYDAAGRLTYARIGGREYQRDFTSPAAAQCPTGTRANAGANGNVVRDTETTAAGTAVTGSCYDDADRLLATTGDHPVTGTTYGLNGHLTGYSVDGRQVTQQQDAAERYRGTAITGDNAAAVTYDEDIADHLTTRTVTTAQGTSTLYYGHTSNSTAAVDLVLDADKHLLTRVVGLPGGVIASVSGQPFRGDGTTWSYPTVRGDIYLLADDNGNRKGDLYRYGLYGEPLAPNGAVDPQRVPDNMPGDFDYGWLGRYRVGTEHQGALYSVVLQTRVYNPALGRFSAPVSGGPFLNPYEYAAGDPVNHTSINGYDLDVEQD
ncbi:PA14 domain-containing protein [Kitasatospora sp. NPDC058190]|uniref:PA14 domain-containing protein n=1 Tax=Kitasatospora sp. NPDC058190 TaxID=3346371 RepID=UPI0036D7CAC4